MKTIQSYQILAIALLIVISVFSSCNKQDNWLDVKRTRTDVTPETLADYQAILDNNGLINKHFANIGLLGADNINIADVTFLGISQLEQDGYLWKASIWDSLSGSSAQWNYFYNIIEYSNIVLDGLNKIDPKVNGYNNVKGQALFLRSMAFYNLAQLFCKAYDGSTANFTLGIPLRISSDVNIIYQRASLQETFELMTDDLKLAAQLLDEQSLTNFRPSKYSSLALLAKIYLVKGDYSNAMDYATQVLNVHSTLLDFNSPIVSLTSTYRFPADGLNNPEVLFQASSQAYNSIRPYSSSTSTVVPELIALYDNNDLRKQVFYLLKGTTYTFKGGYTGTFTTFCGLAINELYLIRAECFARQDNAKKAMDDVNTLLRSRYKTGTYPDIVEDNPVIALDIVLKERRKELPFTGNQRWEDLKRLNKEIDHQTTIVRTVNGNTYTMLPNSNAYALPIPQNEILQSGIKQNER